MKIWRYNLLPVIALGYAEERICQYLKEKGEASSGELYKLSSKKSKPLNRILEKGIIMGKSGKYRLRKTVSCTQYKHIEHISRIEDLKELKLQYIDWYEVEETPEDIREYLLEEGIYLDGESTDIDVNIIEEIVKELKNIT